MAANGGFVCFGSWDGQGILICNPLTNRWKELPAGRLNSRFTTINYLIVNEQRNSYKILIVGNITYRCSDSRYGDVDLYDSMTNTWSLGQSMYVGSLVKREVYCSGVLYAGKWPCQKGSHVVEILDLTTLRWREETIPIPEGFAHDPFVVTCLGQIYLVRERNDTDKYPLASIVIFQLDQSKRWTQLSEYSNEHFFGHSGVLHGCGSNGLKIHVLTNLVGMWVTVYNSATSCWEEPIRIGNVIDFQNMFQTKFTFQPNYRVAP